MEEGLAMIFVLLPTLLTETEMATAFPCTGKPLLWVLGCPTACKASMRIQFSQVMSPTSHFPLSFSGVLWEGNEENAT